MALPATMKILGLILGFSLLVLVGLLTYVSVEFLLRFSKVARANSYGGVMEDAFGHPGKIVLQTSIVLKTLGILIIYMIIIGMCSIYNRLTLLFYCLIPEILLFDIHLNCTLNFPRHG